MIYWWVMSKIIYQWLKVERHMFWLRWNESRGCNCLSNEIIDEVGPLPLVWALHQIDISTLIQVGEFFSEPGNQELLCIRYFKLFEILAQLWHVTRLFSSCDNDLIRNQGKFMIPYKYGGYVFRDRHDRMDHLWYQCLIDLEKVLLSTILWGRR